MSTPPPSDPLGQPSFPSPPAEPAPSYSPPPPAPMSAPPAGGYPPPPPQYAPPQQYAPAPPMGVAPVAGGLYQDPDSGLLIPQGTTLASKGRRIGAYFLALPLAIVTLGIGYIIWGAIAWGKGTSPALQVLGMKVWHPESQQPASWGRMALRDIVGYLVENIIGIVAIISFVLFLSGRERKTLHDMIGGTIVIHDPNKVLG